MKMKQSIQSIDIMEKTFSDIENYHNSCLVSLSLGKQKTEMMSGMFTIQKHDRITWTNIPWWLPIGKSVCGGTGYSLTQKLTKLVFMVWSKLLTLCKRYYFLCLYCL